MKRAEAVAACALLACLPPAQQPSPGLDDLWRARSFTARQASSFDPTGGNDDHGHYAAALPEGGHELLRAPGRGRLVRIWSADPKGILRLVDRVETSEPRVLFTGDFAALFAGRVPPFTGPLVRYAGGGYTSYVPVDFEGGLLATLLPAATGGDLDVYWHLGYELHATPPAADAGTAREALLAGFTESDADTRLRLDDRVLHEAAVVADLEGPGLVRELRFRLIGAAPELLRAVRVEIAFDGADRPAVLSPLADLLGLAFGAGVQTVAVDAVSDARVLRFPMPFRRRAVVRLVHEQPALGPLRFDFAAAWRRLASPPEGMRYLHAVFAHGRTERGRPHRVLAIDGSGHFAGCFGVFEGKDSDLSYLEGDETITIDVVAAFRGTGTEDYFSGAWYFRHGPFATPFASVAVKDEAKGRVAACRLHVADPLPFRQSLVFDLEHGAGNDAPGCTYSTLAFFYHDAPAGRVAALPPALSRGYRGEPPRLAFEVEELAGGRGLFRRLPGRELELSGGAVAALRMGGQHRLALPPLAAGRYAVFLDAVEGETPVEATFGLLGSENRLSLGAGHARRELRLANVEHAGGEALCTVDVTAGTLLLDRLRFERYRPAVRQFLLLGPFPSPGRSGFETDFGPEKAIDLGRDHPVLGTGPRRWFPLAGQDDPRGYVDLDSVFAPNDHVVAYALAHVDAPEARPATLRLGSDDGVKVWWNGELVHARQTIRGAAPDQDAVPVRMQRGRNTLLIKVEENAGWWGFFCRVD
jgi:hypothetical protein